MSNYKEVEIKSLYSADTSTWVHELTVGCIKTYLTSDTYPYPLDLLNEKIESMRRDLEEGLWD